jgi:DNA-binding LytR/AlgR family response regulator
MANERLPDLILQESRLTEPRRILIVDDEPLARQRLRRYLANAAQPFFIEEADSGLAAVAQIQTFRPDIIFLDVEMPGFSGFEVLQQFNERPFQVVFQTAYDEFAIQAFEENACDYLLKPFTEDRFRQALHRVLSRVADEERLKALEDSLAQRQGYLQRLTLKQGSTLRVVESCDISCFISRDHYTCAYLADSREAICDLSLATLLTRLDPQEFQQLHRNNIVRLAALVALTTSRSGEISVTLNNEMNLPVSRRHRQLARHLLKSSL